MHERPPTIIGLIAFSVAVYLYEIVFGRFVSEFAVVPVELKQMFAGGEFNKESIWIAGRLFSAMFLHSDEAHLIYNMVFLWAFGSLCSRYLGMWTTLALFLICGAIGNVAQCWLNLNSSVPIIGASGGIMAFEGIYLALAIRWSLPDPDVWPLAYPIPAARMAAFGVVGFGVDFYSLMNHSGGNVAFGAHIGGFVAGFLLTWLITQLFPTVERYRARWQRR